MQIKVTCNDGGEHAVDYDGGTDTIQVLTKDGTSYAWADVKTIEIVGDEAPAAPVDLFDAAGGDRPVEPVPSGTTVVPEPQPVVEAPVVEAPVAAPETVVEPVAPEVAPVADPPKAASSDESSTSSNDSEPAAPDAPAV